MIETIEAQHGIACRLPDRRFGYFGWPTVARLDDGRLVVGASGLRSEHGCPFGKTVMLYSSDEGLTWSEPVVINDSPLDDRDVGVVSCGGSSILVTWFTLDPRGYFGPQWGQKTEEDRARWRKAHDGCTDEVVKRWLGSWILLSDDGETWSEPIRSPVSTPHGPILRSSGDLLYLGKMDYDTPERVYGRIAACRSTDGGRTWTELGTVPPFEGTRRTNYLEPYAVELPDGKLVGMIRFQTREDDVLADDPAPGLIRFSLFQTESIDGGATWTPAQPTGIYGSPPHLIRHSTGALVCVYGYRRKPFGQRVRVSRDSGNTWPQELILRDDGPDWDLGYPASVEMPDASIFTIYYQKSAAGEQCSLLWSRWKVPGA